MKRILLLAAAYLSACVSAIPAQQPINETPPLNRITVTHNGGVSIPPVYGAPFSATAVIKNEKRLADGSVQTSHNMNLVGRDSLGRTHGEQRMTFPDTVGLGALAEVQIYDPQTRERISYDPPTRTARRQVVPAPRSPLAASNLDVTLEDLGSNTIGTFLVRGTRRTQVIPAQKSGTGAPMTVVDEYWYSEDLHLNILLHHNDPRTGNQTIEFTEIKRGDPPPSFFEVPPGYTVVDLPPAGNVSTPQPGER